MVKPISALSEPLAANAAARLIEAEQRLRALEAQADEAALMGDTRATRQHRAQLDERIATTKTEIDRLRRAHTLAVHKDRIATATGSIRHQRRQFETLKGFAAARHEAAAELAGAIEVATKAYGRFLASTEQMVANLPAGLEWPPGYAEHLTRAEVLVAAELYRHSSINGEGQLGIALPGAKPPSIAVMHQPSAIEPFPDAIERANGYLLNSIRAQIERRERALAGMKAA